MMMDDILNRDDFSLEVADWNKLDQYAKAITNPEMTDSKTLLPCIGGIYDPSIVGKSTPHDEYYSCACTNPDTALVGKINEGRTCPNCGTKVKNIVNNNQKYGYIPLGNSFILTPLGFILLKTMLGSDVEKDSKHQSNFILDRIIDLPPTMTKDGSIKREWSEKSPYRGIGLVRFKEEFLDILDFYHDKIFSNVANIPKYNMVKSMYEDGVLFVNKIYVSPIITRPFIAMHKEKQMKSHPISIKYNTICQLAEKIRTCEVEESDFTSSRVRTLKVLQEKVYELGLFTINSTIKGKQGVPRKTILGARFDNSSRYVIAPLPASMPTLTDQVFIPYSSFVNIFSMQIAYEFIRTHNINPDEYLLSNIKAEIENTSYLFNPEIYNIVLTLIYRDEVKVVINRNPTNTWGSIVTCRVAHVNPEANNSCLLISNNILNLFNGDFDGDHVNYEELLTFNVRAYVEGMTPNMLITSPHGKTFIEGKKNVLHKDMIPALEYLTDNMPDKEYVDLFKEDEREYAKIKC